MLRMDEETAPSYAPKSSEVRSKKFFSLKEATKLYKEHKRNGRPARIYEAEVTEWKEMKIDS